MRAAISPEPALLGFLQAGPLHGYDLHKRLEAELGGVWRLGQSQMYAILKEYETRGYIKTIATQHNGRPARKMLKLTAAGERAFETWMDRTAHGLREFRVDFFVRLYFARTAGRPAFRAFLTKQIRATQKEYDALTEIQASSEFAETVREFRRAQLKTILDWLGALQDNGTMGVLRQPRTKK
jgi:DNA-binding PadR family transcriptional regulator